MTAVTSQFEVTGLKLSSRVAPLNQHTACVMFEASCTFPANDCPLMKGCSDESDECYGCKHFVGTCSYMSAADQCSNTSSGMSTLEVQLSFSRRRWSHVFRTFVPSVVIVGCSWISFWLHPRDVTARVQLCVTVFLALITAMANNRMEHGITAVRAEDVWMCGGIITVGLGLLETVAVNAILCGNAFTLSFFQGHRTRVGPNPEPSTAWADDKETSSPEAVANKIDFFSRILFPITAIEETNVALGKAATQSSTHSPWGPEKAVDGSTGLTLSTSLGSSLACTHTNQEYQPWWKVDLGSIYTVQRVIVVNRADCCGERLQNFAVRVGLSDTGLENDQCGETYTDTPTDGQAIVVDCYPPMLGRYVSIQLVERTDALTLCEVEVYGAVCPIPDYVQFNGVCYKDFAQEKTNGEARQRCAEDGGVIAMPKDNATNTFLSDLTDGRRWLGLTDTGCEGQWVFEDGQAMESSGFSNWNPDQPNNSDEDCAVLSSDGFVWMDTRCGYNRGFVCRVDQAAEEWLSRDSSWVVDSSGTPYASNGVTYDAAKTLDGDTRTYWNPYDLDYNYNNWYIVLDLTEPYTLTSIAVNSYGDTTHDIAAFTLQKSQVGSPYNWEYVVSVTGMQAGTDHRQVFAVSQGTARYWKFVVTRTHSGYQPFLKELNLYGISSNVCPVPDYISFNGDCYKDFAEEKTYNEAKKTCAEDGGVLAMPKDNATNTFISNLRNEDGFRWLGLTDANNEGQWVFEDGQILESSGYSNWYPGQPDNIGEDCVELLEESLWNDKRCTASRGFVCQAVQCPLLTAPVNGSLTGSNSYRNTVLFTCDPGYQLVGGNRRTCRADGTWNDSNPTCIACLNPLGMESGAIPDDSITASSTWNSDHLPRDGRLNRVQGHGAWSAGNNSIGQWLQVDLGEMILVSGTIIQGRVYSVSGQWVTSYKLHYSADGISWTAYANSDGSDKVFAGNTDRNTPVTNLLDHPVATRYVRVVVQSWYTHISMRLEVLGCYGADLVGMWPLNALYGSSDVTGNGNDGVATGVQLTPGPFGDSEGAFLFSGATTSYLKIPNNGRLDVRFSFTILGHIFPTGGDGPIFDYVGSDNTWAVHLWQLSSAPLFMRVAGRDGSLSSAVSADVLQQNTWSYVGGTYDSFTGVESIWNDGELVGETHIGVAEVASQYPVRVAVRDGDDRYFAGRIACLQLYNYAMTKEQIAAARDKCRECPNTGYVYFNGICYKSFTERKTRDEARQACAVDGGILAMPKDSETNAFLASLPEVTGGRWLGLTDPNGDGQWVYDDGQNLTSSDYSNWQPDDRDNGSGCVAFWARESVWDPRACNYCRGFICQLPKGYVSFNGRCYKDFPEQKTYNEARQACAEDGGLLAMPKESATNTFISGLRNGDQYRWLGLTDASSEGQWVFEDGQTLEPSDYSNWRPGEPNNVSPGEDCVLLWDADAMWNDASCSATAGFICQIGMPCSHPE
ncbi:uncharacterized protein LOC118403649 [Branchiostoma floridae]|uniref:Uncharacterized protein LOC118403649 n=1 Tax=Branchiostoma floridae TaxID=7739 RepID=A0A9J7HI20_BRAFL|nr:uncharacterized protein LOC118403649 [Branchiostoma floridae]